MYEPYKTRRVLRLASDDPFKILGAAYLLLWLLLFRRKIFFFTLFPLAKHTAGGVRFLLGFNVYLFLAQCEQVHLFSALALLQIRSGV